MKTVMITGCLLLFTFFSKAQNQTIKLYMQQIAANKIYIEYLQKATRLLKTV